MSRPIIIAGPCPSLLEVSGGTSEKEQNGLLFRLLSNKQLDFSAVEIIFLFFYPARGHKFQK
jgi:hypothetical protein